MMSAMLFGSVSMDPLSMASLFRLRHRRCEPACWRAVAALPVRMPQELEPLRKLGIGEYLTADRLLNDSRPCGEDLDDGAG
jgi:hypothetical protein